MIKKIINVATLFVALISSVFAFEMNMNTLYLTENRLNSMVSSMLDSYGMNYDIVQLPAKSLVLEKDNVALYNSIVIENAKQETLSGIKAQIEEYSKKYKIRIAYLNSEPDQSVAANSQQSIFMRNVVLTDQGYELASKYQMNGKDVQFTVGTCILDTNFQCIQYTHYEVDPIIKDSIKPLLKYTDIEAYAGALVNSNGIESIHFWIPFIDSHIAYFASHLWISYINYGLIDGYRRLFFEIQVDDYFTDNCFNSSDCSATPDAPHYRTSVEDMENIAKWQKDISSRMPKGSDFKVELAINGIHILTKAQHKQYEIRNWTDYLFPYEYKKPLNEHGSSRWPEKFDDDWDDKILQDDKLYKHFKNHDNQDNFFWLTHTFSHQKLDYASYRDTDLESKENIKMSKEPYLGMYDRDCYSKHSIVTPEISGLHNGDALKALTDNEVYYAVGDTSRVDVSPENFYLPFITNMTTSNFDGFVVIPRQPPQVYWDCSTIEENMEVYKMRYPDRTNVTWEQHLNEEADLHAKNFLKLRHDPYMFHEGNLRNSDFKEVSIGSGKGKYGMLQQWVERVTEEIQKYMNWPLVSIKMDNLAQTYLTRISKEQCKPKYTMVVDDSSFKISEIKVKATTGECKVPLLAIKNTEFDKSTVDSIEKLGMDPQTAWINVNDKSVKSVKFTSSVQWNDDSYTAKSGSIIAYSISSLKILLLVGIATLFIMH
ncbi:hypothetical protein BCR36DRAFT_583206 [Piromyces finnis]|uniref:Agd3 deacetylase domain-containing protein n=1 Tax=Piromyces finnis TaxID=1754191 RepID=A0A1Y1V9G9_9FUNG|nr:hypothetical protein BCR36DRAFT_583206 [Piromyces finnis]|eukprot:ORX50620.1 hypothetical protein BCR36DRAFT_583206 [Piromyces finnis]